MELKPLADRLGLDLPEFLELVALFVATSHRDLDRMEDAFRNRNPKAASAAAHSLKGAAANLGFELLAEEADAVEQRTRKGELDPVAPRVLRLRNQVTAIGRMGSAAEGP